MKQRLFLSLLSIMALVMFALPQLQIRGEGIGTLFTWVWLGFCMIAFGGNLAGLLYRKAEGRGQMETGKTTKSKKREYRRRTSI